MLLQNAKPFFTIDLNHMLTPHSQQYRFFKKNPSVLSPGEPCKEELLNYLIHMQGRVIQVVGLYIIVATMKT